MGKKKLNIIMILQSRRQFRGIGEGRKFYIRTYGCQMNEHDTEVMAGIFMALGYEATNQYEDADVILLKYMCNP